MILVLSLICGASGYVLATLKEKTAPRIEVQELTFVKGPALATAFGSFDNDPIAERKSVALPDGGHLLVFPARQGGKLVAVAFERFANGFGGPVGVMVGFDLAKDALTGIGITTLHETPGVGMRVTGMGFLKQYRDHPFSGLALKSQGGDVDAVSGATISSTAVSKAVGDALATYKAIKPELLKAFSGGAA